MPGEARYLLTVAMDVDPDKEALFNEVYDTEHVPLLSRVPGVLSIRRYRNAPLTMTIGGERKSIVMETQPRYLAVYELASPDVLVSDAWAKAIDEGRWATQVRPYTRNRQHALHERLD